MNKEFLAFHGLCPIVPQTAYRGSASGPRWVLPSPGPFMPTLLPNHGYADCLCANDLANANDSCKDRLQSSTT